MSFIESLGAALLCAVGTLVLRESKSPLAPFLSVGGGMLLLLALLPRLEDSLSVYKELEAGIGKELGGTVGKVLALSFLSGVTIDICRDLQAPILADRVAFVCKMEILLLTLPVLKALLTQVEALL